MTISTNGVDLDTLGRPIEQDVFGVTAEDLAAFAAATNDPVEAHRRGDLAGPVFAVRLAWRAGYPQLLETLSPEARRRTLHGSQDIRLSRPIRPGMRLVTRASIVSASSTPAGLALTARSRSYDRTDLVVDQLTTLMVRATAPDESQTDPRKTTPDPTRGAAVGRVESVTSRRQIRAYGDAAQDHEAIHLDIAAARAAGFDDVIMHGNCSLAIAVNDVVGQVCDGDVRRVRRVRGRMSSPVTPGDAIATSIWESLQDGTYLFESAVRDSDLCLRSGLVEIDGIT